VQGWWPAGHDLCGPHLFEDGGLQVVLHVFVEELGHVLRALSNDVGGKVVKGVLRLAVAAWHTTRHRRKKVLGEGRRRCSGRGAPSCSVPRGCTAMQAQQCKHSNASTAMQAQPGGAGDARFQAGCGMQGPHRQCKGSTGSARTAQAVQGRHRHVRTAQAVQGQHRQCKDGTGSARAVQGQHAHGMHPAVLVSQCLQVVHD